MNREVLLEDIDPVDAEKITIIQATAGSQRLTRETLPCTRGIKAGSGRWMQPYFWLIKFA